MKKVTKKRKKTEPVHVEPQYTLGLGYNPADPKQSLQAILGKHQAKYMENIFTEMNKFTKTAVMTVVPELFGQLMNVLKSEKQRLIAEQLEIEAGDEKPALEVVKNEIEPIPSPKQKDAPQQAPDSKLE